MELEELRKEIDDADSELTRIFIRRMELADGVAEYKKQRGLPVLDARREEEKLKTIRGLAGAE